jgi:hypothetical protein
VPVLPLIDLLILVSWTVLMWAFVHKALWLALANRFTVLGLTPYDFLLGAGVLLLFALALAARVWVKANEGALLRARMERGRLRPEVLPDHPHPHEMHGATGAEASSAASAASGVPAGVAPGARTERAATG